MRASWTALPTQLELPTRSVDDLSDLDIVDEFNGPQIVFGNLDGERVFGVAADEDDAVERWVFAPVSPLEERALKEGVASLREALRKDSARIVDFLKGHGGLRVIPVSGELLSDNELPTAEARLEVTPSVSPVATGELSFVLDRIGGVSAGLPLKAVAEFLNNLQRYADAVVAFVDSSLSRVHGRLTDDILAKAAFSLQAATAGSLALGVAPADHGLAQRVVAHLRQAVDAADRGDRLATLAEKGGARALLRYEDLLATLQRHQLQLLARGGTDLAFVSWTSAGRFSRAMPEVVQREVEPLVVRGFFRDFGREKAEFVFVDIETDEVLQGSIATSVLDENVPVTVHESARYIVLMERQLVTTRDDKTLRRHVLVRFLDGVSPASQ
jgi:hypothetical protein